MTDRRLAAILAADVVGYAAMMAEDEAGTLEALRRLRRELFHPAVAGHRGKVVKAMGDGWLVEFASAVDAVNCAVQVQNGLEPDATVRIRIGVHIGDVTHEEEDVFGDGVNVAARLEALAEPGAIAISDAVYGALDGTLRPFFDDTGERRLKNIPRPTRVWMRRPEALPSEAREEGTSTAARTGFPVVVVVRPVASTDPREEVLELAAALTSDLFTYLGNGRWLAAVVAETPPAGAFVLSANLRGRGDRLRLEANVTGRDGGLLWSQRFDGSLADSFDWQDETGARLASGTHAAVYETEIGRLDGVSDAEKTSVDWLLRAMLTESAGEIEAARDRFRALEQAIAQDPRWGLPYAFGAFCCEEATTAGLEDQLRDQVRHAERWIEMAHRHSGGDLLTELYAAYAAHRLRPALAMLRTKIDAVLRRYPYHETALLLAASAYVYAGEPQFVVDCATRRLVSVAAAPDAERANRALGAAYAMLGRDEEALASLRAALDVNPDSILTLRAFAAVAALAGRGDEARAAVARAQDLVPDITIATIARTARFADTPGTRRFFDGLRLAGFPEGEA